MIEIWFSFRASILNFFYKIKKNYILSSRQKKLKNLWGNHQHGQVKDLVVCIDFKIRLIGSLFPKKLISDVEDFKFSCINRETVESLKKLSDILYLANLETIEFELYRLIEEQRKT